VIDLNGFGYTTQAQMTQDGSSVIFEDQNIDVIFRNTALADITDDMILI
jgi:hypothetical protein